MERAGSCRRAGGCSRLRWRALGEEVAEFRGAGEERLVEVAEVVGAIERGCPGAVERVEVQAVAPQSRQCTTGRWVLLSLPARSSEWRSWGSASTEATMRLSSRSQSCTRRLSQGTTTGCHRAWWWCGGHGRSGPAGFRAAAPGSAGGTIPEAELAGEALQQLLDRAGAGGLAHQVVHGRQGAELAGPAPGARLSSCTLPSGGGGSDVPQPELPPGRRCRPRRWLACSGSSCIQRLKPWQAATAAAPHRQRRCDPVKNSSGLRRSSSIRESGSKRLAKICPA